MLNLERAVAVAAVAALLLLLATLTAVDASPSWPSLSATRITRPWPRWTLAAKPRSSYWPPRWTLTKPQTSASQIRQFIAKFQSQPLPVFASAVLTLIKSRLAAGVFALYLGVKMARALASEVKSWRSRPGRQVTSEELARQISSFILKFVFAAVIPLSATWMVQRLAHASKNADEQWFWEVQGEMHNVGTDLVEAFVLFKVFSSVLGGLRVEEYEDF